MEEAKLKRILKQLSDTEWCLHVAMNDAANDGDKSTADWLEKKIEAINSARLNLRKFRKMQNGANK